MTADGNPHRPTRHLGRRGPPNHSTRRGAAGRSGFTILEVLVAMGLMAFGVLSFTGILKAIGNVEGEDTWKTKALFCAQERMEELTFASLTGRGLTTEGKEIVSEGPYRGIRREWRTGHSSVFDGLLQLDVECAYPWKGSTKSVALSTLILVKE